jgi:hypothetical protein
MRFGASLLFLLLSILSPAQKIHLKKIDGGFLIKENDNKIFFFQREVNDSFPLYARNNYFHPLYDLNGNCITEDFPADHRHHRGLFWSWHQVLVEGKPLCDPWELKNFTQNVDHVEFHINDDGLGIFSYSTFWHTLNNPDDSFLREHTTVNIYPATKNYRRIDFTIQLQALEHHLTIGGSNDDRGYSGFSIRLKTDQSTIFSNSEKQVIIPQKQSIPNESYIDISNKALKSGITILPWPQNPKPYGWILRQTESMQNCAWPGRNPVELSIEQATVLKYTLIIHQGNRNKIPFSKIEACFNTKQDE